MTDHKAAKESADRAQAAIGHKVSYHSGGILESIKKAYKQQVDVENEYRKGVKGEATKQAEKEGKSYHPFTGMTW